MAAAQKTLTIEQGSTWTYDVRWKPAKVNAWPDLTPTGHEAWLTVREGTNGPVWLSLSTDDDHITLTSEGWIHITLSAEETAELESKPNLQHNLLLGLPSGIKRRITEGPVKLNVEVPRA